MTAFRSPAMAAPSRSLPSQGQRSRPATSRPTEPPSLPVRNHAPQPRPVCPGPDRFAAWTPLQFLRPIRIAASPECPPLGTVTSLGISGKIGSAATQSAFRIRPISLRSPALLLFPGSAPDHRSRTATFPLGSLFLKPLGTSLNMPWKPSRVNTFARFPQAFSTAFMYLYFHQVRGNLPVETAVQKPGPGESVFT